MSNTYFQFKQFTIHQDKCAMKVCTDGCLFGAWIAERVRSTKYDVRNVLDIGTGTGLLSLLIAQQTTAQIDAIEMDEAAAEQAVDNFENSFWKERLQVIVGDARNIHLGKKYDLIISNPPFFDNDLKSSDAQRNLALHSEQLSLEELMFVISSHITDHGKFTVLLPYHRKNEFIEIAKSAGFFPEEMISVKQSPNHQFFRVMFLFSKAKIPSVERDLIIRDGNDYTQESVELLKGYYLKL